MRLVLGDIVPKECDVETFKRCFGARNINMHEEGMTPLAFHALHGNLEVVEFLLEQGAKIDTGRRSYNHPLGCAVVGGHYEIAELLLQNGADPNYPGIHFNDLQLTPYNMATMKYDMRHGITSPYNRETAKYGDDDIIQLLKRNGGKYIK